MCIYIYIYTDVCMHICICVCTCILTRAPGRRPGRSPPPLASGSQANQPWLIGHANLIMLTSN